MIWHWHFVTISVIVSFVWFVLNFVIWAHEFASRSSLFLLFPFFRLVFWCALYKSMSVLDLVFFLIFVTCLLRDWPLMLIGCWRPPGFQHTIKAAVSFIFNEKSNWVHNVSCSPCSLVWWLVLGTLQFNCFLQQVELNTITSTLFEDHTMTLVTCISMMKLIFLVFKLSCTGEVHLYNSYVLPWPVWACFQTEAADWQHAGVECYHRRNETLERTVWQSVSEAVQCNTGLWLSESQIFLRASP